MTPNERKFLDMLWRRSIGLPELEPAPRRLPDLQSLIQTERVQEADDLGNSRFVMGAFRYGLISEQDFSEYDLLGECKKRMSYFQNDGNLEHLIDAMNMLKLRFYWGRKNGETFKSVDDGPHAEKLSKCKI